MNRYGTAKKCVKCGEGRYYRNGPGDKFKAEYLPDRKPECMRITCSRCGYLFYEAPLDDRGASRKEVSL